MKTLVKQSKLKFAKHSFVFGVLLLIIIILIAINPAKYSSVAFNGLSVWAKILVPSLLPFFVLTKVLASTGIIDDICRLFSPITRKFYKCPPVSAYVFLMSIITGYPVGSKLISDLYKNNQLSSSQAIKTASFCSTSGPMFILGTVAIGMFANAKMGYIILISHVVGALINGLLYRNIKSKTLNNNFSNISQDNYQSFQNLHTSSIQNESLNNENSKPNNVQQPIAVNKHHFDFSQSVMSSVNSILLIGGVICFTFVILEVITSSRVFLFITTLLSNIGLNGSLISSIFCGIGEITKGCLMLSSTLINTQLATCIACFIISFGGISTFLQAYAFLKNIVPAKTFLLQKLTHAICSTAICILLVLIF